MNLPEIKKGDIFYIDGELSNKIEYFHFVLDSCVKGDLTYLTSILIASKILPKINYTKRISKIDMKTEDWHIVGRHLTEKEKYSPEIRKYIMTFTPVEIAKWRIASAK